MVFFLLIHIFHFHSHRYNEFWPIWLAPTALIGFLTCFLHLLNRQVELASRSDFLWQYKLSSEEEGVDTMRGINKILLENILPAHVAEHYLLGVQGVSGILQDSNVIMLANHGIRHTYFLPNTGSPRYLWFRND